MDRRVKPTAVRHEMCLNRRTALILLDSSRLRINWTRKGINAVRHQNSVFHGLLEHVPWATLDRLAGEHEAGRDPRSLQARAHLIAMLYVQLSGSRSLRDIETSLKSQAARLYHLRGAPVSRSALATAHATRPCHTLAGTLAALMAQLQRGYRRKIGDCVRLI